ncbi:unnamed protein product [Cuscuta europaea]|nr:unnamed protein product [Cuscuta europaea]
MEVLSSISGVYSVNIDAEQGLATVVGEVEPNALLRALSKSGEHAELVRVTLKDPRMNRYSNYEASYAYNKSYDNGNYNAYGYNAIGDSNIRASSKYQTDARGLPGYDYSREANHFGGSYLPPAQYAPSYPMQQVVEYEDANSSVPLCSIM